jgi:Tfp pilus assembly protein PilO
MSLTRRWSFLTAVAVVAILAAGWFLLVSPKRGEASELKASTISQEEANSRLQSQIEMLQAQQADLPKKRAELAALGRQIPNNPALPTLIRSLTAASRQVGVSLDSMSPAVPVPMVDPALTAPVAAPSATSGTNESNTADATAEESTPAPAAPAAVPPSLYQVPLTVKMTGSFFELEQFISKLEGLKRSFLVTGFSVGAVAGETATQGDLELTLQGRVFLAPEQTTTTPTVPVATTPAVQ